MGYRSLRQCVADLERNGHLIRVKAEVDPYLEMAEIQRRLYAVQGPAVLFENVKGSPFPAVCNLFGTLERSRFMFRDSYERVQKLFKLKANPAEALKKPLSNIGLARTALHALPKKALYSRPILYGETQISQLPQIQSWPDDGGAFVTLPQVYSEDPLNPGVMQSNVGMYRIQLIGNNYEQDREIGMHYQIHRGIGVHHSRAREAGKPLKVSIFVGGPPAHTLAAVMPLPEGLSELMFAGMIGGKRFRHFEYEGHRFSADADFVITGTIADYTKPEGPFGDHLGYYSLQHEFPVLKVDKVYHRKGAIWPFTVVGRPPQEDTSFGALIHELTAPVVPSEIPGLHAMHAVDAAGVHPLLLAIGSERYVPYREREPQEILTIANAVLGFGQASLAKYLLITAKEDAPDLDIHDIEGFFRHILERADWRRDLHFQTRTTIDTLDYSGTGLNAGSKLVIAAAGPARFELKDSLSGDLSLPEGYADVGICMPGIAVVKAPVFSDYNSSRADCAAFCEQVQARESDWEGIRLIILADDPGFVRNSLNNFLWTVFTRSNPSHDVHGAGSFTEFKHWGCTGPLVIDARIKPHHAPPLIEDVNITRKVDSLSQAGGPFHGIF